MKKWVLLLLALPLSGQTSKSDLVVYGCSTHSLGRASHEVCVVYEPMSGKHFITSTISSDGTAEGVATAIIKVEAQ